MTDKGAESGYRRWISSAPKAVFLLVHGLGANAGRWEAMAGYFMERGVSSYAVELDGHGGFRGYFDQILKLRGIAARENPSRKIFIIGESMGALISLFSVSSHPGLFDGLVCISPAFANKVKLSVMDSFKMAAALLYSPGKLFKVPFDSSMCTRDVEYRKKMDADPAEHRSYPARLLAEILFYQARAGFLANPDGPALFLMAGDDRIADNRRTRAVFGRLSSGDKTIVEFPGMYHSMSVDAGKETVFESINDWIQKRL